MKIGYFPVILTVWPNFDFNLWFTNVFKNSPNWPKALQMLLRKHLLWGGLPQRFGAGHLSGRVYFYLIEVSHIGDAADRVKHANSFYRNFSVLNTHELKSNRPNHANRPFWQIDLANRPNSYLSSHDLHSSLKSN